ncbi:PREDICTED: uncharacterized protein LOC109184412 [Ipomoea nil]|uniref:uncharacterized protein LOC109184412 n=1 Tax=Ipomoea nil TaxID=35883 RepID=UPI0009016605|nr:PREDICTED: uncharacterized protein LOC109184412 [Ipomoea nil]
MTMSLSSFLKNPRIVVKLRRRAWDLDRRLLLLILFPISLLLVIASLSPFSAAVRSILGGFASPPPGNESTTLRRSRIAVCLVGGARRFELTGPSIIQNILGVYPNSDLFLHSPLDSNAYKLSLLKSAPRIAAVKIFKPTPIDETEARRRVLTAAYSPNGIQGLLQYFNLVEGCLTMIEDHQRKNNFTYDWIIRTRVDGYWSGSLREDHFIPGRYVVPSGSSYRGLNDRFGIGDFNTSTAALSRLSLIPQLDAAGYKLLNSENAFKAQLETQKVSYSVRHVPFCVVTNHRYEFPPSSPFYVPVAEIFSRSPLNGAKCKPCTPFCGGSCVGSVMGGLEDGWGWSGWGNDTLRLCDANADWEEGWEKLFDRGVGKKLASARKRVKSLDFGRCVNDFEVMKGKTTSWVAPPEAEICSLGIS